MKGGRFLEIDRDIGGYKNYTNSDNSINSFFEQNLIANLGDSILIEFVNKHNHSRMKVAYSFQQILNKDTVQLYKLTKLTNLDTPSIPYQLIAKTFNGRDKNAKEPSQLMRNIQYLEDFRCNDQIKFYIVNFRGIDLMIMPSATKSLSKFIEDNKMSPFFYDNIINRFIFAREVFMIIIEQIYCLNERGFIYTDIDSDNILINIERDRIELLLGDIDFCNRIDKCLYHHFYRAISEPTFIDQIFGCFGVFIQLLTMNSDLLRIASYDLQKFMNNKTKPPLDLVPICADNFINYCSKLFNNQIVEDPLTIIKNIRKSLYDDCKYEHLVFEQSE